MNDIFLVREKENLIAMKIHISENKRENKCGIASYILHNQERDRITKDKHIIILKWKRDRA